VRYPRAAQALLVVSVGCALGLWWGYRTRLDYWDVSHFVALLLGGLLAATLATALSWRHEGGLQRTLPRVLTLGFALVWIHTWCEPLQQLVVWFATVRFLWLQV